MTGNRRMKNLFGKLHSEAGESIGEALAAMLIVAFGAIMLAGMVQAASRIVTRSEESYHAYLQDRNAIESRVGGSQNGDDGTVSLQNVSGDYTIAASAGESVIIWQAGKLITYSPKQAE